MNRFRLRVRGFTLIEMMVTIAIMAILAMIAVPAFRDATRRGQVARASNTLLADLSYARTEAVTRGLDVSVCPSSDGVSCLTTTTYDTGWMIYTYTPGNAVANAKYDSTSANNLLLHYTQSLAGVSIRGTDDSANSDVITFNAQGQQLPKAATKLNFVTCYRDSGADLGTSTSSAPGVQLTLSTSGSASTVPVAAGGSCAAS
jgi:type IV fimbrial biogenesis protein FimT